MKNFLWTLLVLFTLTPFCFGQDTPKNEPAQWALIESPKKDLSFSVPADFLIDKEDRKYQVIAYQDGVMMRVEIDTSGDSKERIHRMRNFGSVAKVSRFTLGDFIGDVHEHDPSKRFLTSIYTASSKAFYSISVSSKDTQSPLLVKFLYSIKLDGRPLYKREGLTESKQEAKISIDTLETSSIISEALKRKDAKKTKIKYDFKGDKILTSDEDVEDPVKYSRSLVILRKPRPSYTDSGRQNGVSGTIKLKVHFRANGEISDIVILKRLGHGLDENAADAVRKIKFLPAEIDGKPVDAVKILEYSFTVY